MASLTHVCVWDDKGWKHITAEDAARLHPGGTVAAGSGLFMCELCGQYVSLTDGSVRKRYFKHSRGEKDKDCPERQANTNIAMTYEADQHELPLRIANISRNDFNFEIGFIPIPRSLFKKELKVDIRGKDRNQVHVVYMGERLNPDNINYLSVGNIPCNHYLIHISDGSDSLHKYWPSMMDGVDPEGTLFDGITGKRLVADSDVSVGKKYYLLKRGYLYSSAGSHVTSREIASKMVSFENWKLYEISANDYHRNSAEFFLDFHYRLAEDPLNIQPVWPIYIEKPYVIQHNMGNVYLHMNGYAPTTQVFPFASKISYLIDEVASVLKISCNSRQQLISAGRARALQYTYFWREALDGVAEFPDVVVTDEQGDAIEQGVRYELPKNQILKITTSYDGSIWISENGKIKEKRNISANTTTFVDGVTWDTQLEIYVGMDVLWTGHFLKVSHDNNSSKDVLKKLQAFSGREIEVPHSLANLGTQLQSFPELQKWVYSCIRRNSIDDRAFKRLKKFVIEVTTNQAK